VTALGDADPETREQTAWALGAIGDGRAGAGLAAALGDADPRVREQAAWALGAIGRAGRR
jgi:HEAT repeat protein